MSTEVRVLVVDDHPVVRTGLRAVLATTAGVQQVGEASSGEEGVVLSDELMPDVVIMDIHMPGIGGIEATRQVVAAHPNIAVLVLTMHDDDDTIFAAMRSGARGYLLKGAEQEEVARAILGVASGDAIFGPAIADRVLRYFAAPRPPADPFPDLSGREREVLDLLAGGHNNLAIARQLDLTSKTVANHVSNILNKLQAADRAEAIVKARRAGLGG
jgi:DNA-binding NarL/FixJ family response regulator